MHAEPLLPSPTPILALARAHSGFRSRIGHLVLFLVGIAAAVALASLLLTEAELPARTTAALGGLLALNLAWAAYAAWVLTARRTMLFNHRVVAARIATAAAVALMLGSAAYGVLAGAAAGYVAAGLGAILSGIAAVLLRSARRDWRALSSRRAELEAALAAAR